VWDEIYSRVVSLKMAWIFEPKDVRDALKAFTRELAGPKAKSLGWTIAPDEDHIQRQFKSVAPPSRTKLILDNVRNGWTRR
jgi:aminopeptidase 2